MKVKVLDTVYDLVTLNMEQRFSERVALRFYNKDTDEVTTVLYKDYARDIRRAVSYFQSTIPDIKGKKICLLNKNCYEYAVNSFGIMLAGGVLVLLNQHKSWDELSYELGLVEPTAILTDGDDYGTKEQLEAGAKLFDELTGVMGLLYNRKQADAIPAEVTELVEQRKAARKAKDFAEADRLRDAIAALGYTVRETRQGTEITKIES